MLTATEEERSAVVGYMEWQAPDMTVEFAQKVYSENVLDHRHDVWDVHTDKDRWWVITNPTNLYLQEQFPNMDYAMTFHVGLCIRIPRSEKPHLGGLPIEPFAECYRGLSEASEALTHAEEASDYRAVGVRCREALLAFAHVGQLVVPWTSDATPPKRSDFKAWVEHICDATLAGRAQEYRRQLFKRLLTSAWDFSAWLTHASKSRWHDAEAAVETTGNAVGLAVSMVIQHVRGVPDACPSCGSHKLTPLRAFNPEEPEEEWERPACTKCDWMGEPVTISKAVETDVVETANASPEGECLLPQPPLRKLKRPGDE